jgi:hypothetical protein
VHVFGQTFQPTDSYGQALIDLLADAADRRLMIPEINGPFWASGSAGEWFGISAGCWSKIFLTIVYLDRARSR